MCQRPPRRRGSRDRWSRRPRRSPRRRAAAPRPGSSPRLYSLHRRHRLVFAALGHIFFVRLIWLLFLLCIFSIGGARSFFFLHATRGRRCIRAVFAYVGHNARNELARLDLNFLVLIGSVARLRITFHFHLVCHDIAKIANNINSNNVTSHLLLHLRVANNGFGLIARAHDGQQPGNVVVHVVGCRCWAAVAG